MVGCGCVFVVETSLMPVDGWLVLFDTSDSLTSSAIKINVSAVGRSIGNLDCVIRGD